LLDAPKKYRKIPREVEAMRIIDYSSMKKAVAWVGEHGGFAKIINMGQNGGEKLIVETALGLVEVPRQYFLIKGDLGGFYSYPSDIFTQEYAALGVQDG